MNTRQKPADEIKPRQLRFETIQDCMTEVECILAADVAGTLRPCGDWTAGQVMAHVAAWIQYGYEGYPIAAPPWFVRWWLRLRLKKLLRDGMPRGVRIPGVRGGTTGQDEMSTAAAGKRLIAALRRLQDGEPAKFHSPAFGPMSQEDRVMLNLRHAELHLGYLRY